MSKGVELSGDSAEGVSSDNFRVISHDDEGAAVRCSYCARGVRRVVVLPITPRPELDESMLIRLLPKTL